MTAALPPVVDAGTWQRQLDALRAREKAATRELDAIAAQRRRLPMVKMPDYTLEGEQGPTEQLSYTFALIDLLPCGRQEEWQDSPEGWPQAPAYSRWSSSEDVAARYGPDA